MATAARRCPRCRLRNPVTATWCECGGELGILDAGGDPPRTKIGDEVSSQLREMFCRAGLEPALFDGLGDVSRFVLASLWPAIEAHRFEQLLPNVDRLVDLPPSAREALVAWLRASARVRDAALQSLAERHGRLTLEHVGYDEPTRMVEVDGCTRDDGPSEATLQSVLDDIRRWSSTHRDDAGRVVDAVRVVFPEEWMARDALGLLRFAGARVFYVLRETEALVEVS